MRKEGCYKFVGHTNVIRTFLFTTSSVLFTCIFFTFPSGAVLPSGAPVVHDETINYSSLAEVMVTPSVATETDPPMVAIETDSIDPEDQLAIPVPPTQATRAESKENITVPPVEQAMVKATPSKSSKGVAKKTKGPILLYKWSFKVMANNIIVLLGYKRYILTSSKQQFGLV